MSYTGMSGLTPFSKGLMDTLAPPKQANVRVELTAAPIPPKSTHTSLTEETEHQMIGTMQDLRVDAVEKNRELEENLSSVAARRDDVLSRLVNKITPERVERLARQRAAMEVALQNLELDLSERITAVFQRHEASLDPPKARMEQSGIVEADFYFKTVPALFESQCGAAVDKMQGERLALQLNSATVRVMLGPVSAPS